MKRITKIIGIGISFLLYKWLTTVIDLVKRICKAKARNRNDKRELPRRIRKAAKYPCVPIRHPNYHRPDPMIYSQFYLMKQGLAVTWDNPDIQLYENGIAIPSYAVKPDSEYEIAARCWNLSYDAPVVGMPVRFTYLDFGAGTANNPIDQTHVNLSVIGGSENPSFARVKWRTPRLAGHYCIQVKLDWSDDINPENNLGQENLTIAEANSPAVFEFKTRNNTKREHKYHIEADAYTIPPLLPCNETKRFAAGKKEAIVNRNSREMHMIPDNWKVEYDEESFLLNPGAEKISRVTVTPPDNFTGTKPFNFNVFDEQNVFIGGVTAAVTKK